MCELVVGKQLDHARLPVRSRDKRFGSHRDLGTDLPVRALGQPNTAGPDQEESEELSNKQSSKAARKGIHGSSLECGLAI
jgi:hypothetical protein